MSEAFEPWWVKVGLSHAEFQVFRDALETKRLRLGIGGSLAVLPGRRRRAALSLIKRGFVEEVEGLALETSGRWPPVVVKVTPESWARLEEAARAVGALWEGPPER